MPGGRSGLSCADRGAVVAVPAIIASERDMLPPERCDVAGGLSRHRHAGDSLFEMAGVPQNDGGDEKIEAGGAVGMVFEPAVAQFAGAG